MGNNTMNTIQKRLLSGAELANKLTKEQAAEVEEAMERIRMGVSGYYHEIAKLVLEVGQLKIKLDDFAEGDLGEES